MLYTITSVHTCTCTCILILVYDVHLAALSISEPPGISSCPSPTTGKPFDPGPTCTYIK